MTAQRPIHEIRLGRVKVAIWENETERGTRYGFSFSKIYRVKEEERTGKQDNGWRETQSFGRDDLPLLAKVADMAHTWAYSPKEDEQKAAA